MSIPQRISAFHDLGQFFLFVTGNETDKNADLSKYEYLKGSFFEVLKLAEIQNPWFTQDNLKFCLNHWGSILHQEKLENFISTYQSISSKKRIGIVMAGNIPLVGFHDLLCALLSGHDAIVKTSSKDEVLMNFAINYLKDFDPSLNSSIELAKKLENYDAIIATGSNNTSRYFEYYFSEFPHIIRKNRTSVAVLDGNEIRTEIKKLSEDVFRYFGLGCRNVTKIYLPKGFEMNRLFEEFLDWGYIINHSKYANNYDYNRAIFFMENIKFLDNNFILLRESNNLYSPISVLNYEFYTDLNEVKIKLNYSKDLIQCVVGKEFDTKFGETQKPKLDEFADGEDTMKFLTSL